MIIETTIIIVLAGVSALSILKKASNATINECDAFDRLWEWQVANPDLYVGDSPEARNLVWECIKAYRQFLLTHFFVKKDQKYIDYLLSLLDEKAPPPPSKTKSTPKDPRKTDLFSFHNHLGALLLSGLVASCWSYTQM